MERKALSCIEMSWRESSPRRLESLGHAIEHAPVGMHQIETGQQDEHEHGCLENIDVAFDDGID